MRAVFLCVVLTLSCISQQTYGQEVETKTGKVKGATVDAPNGKKVNKFLGIPFAEPPIGELRFKVPKPKAPWAEPIDATKEPPQCTQIKADSFAMAKGFDAKAELGDTKVSGGALQLGFENEGKKDSEDCLFLNIFAPADATPDSKLGVLLWIHGGAFYAGGMTIPTFDGTVLVSEGNVVLVNIQYRLGVYGFLHAGTPEIPGNMGLRDQLEAMKWVQENIAAFGGDPEKVTLFGENSGGWSAGFHLISPMSQKYFSRVIMQSGSALSPLMLFGETAAKARFQKFAIAANCPMGEKADPKEPFAPPTQATYDCFAGLTADAIDKAQATVLSSRKDAGFLPSEDNTKDICFFCQNPFDFMKEGNFEKPDIMLGTNSNEGGMFLSTGLRDIYPPLKGEPKPATLSDLVDHAKANGAGANAGQMQMMLPMFFRGVNKKDPVAVRERLLGLISDGMFVCPDLLLVNAFSKKGAAWYYRFDYRPSKSYWNTWLKGAMHMDELQFVFGLPFKPELKDNYNDADRVVSKVSGTKFII